MADQTIIDLTADIVAAHVSNNAVAASELPALIQSVHAALTSATQPPAPAAVKQEPAVSIRSSVKPDHIVCLEDGAKLKMLKRYLRTRFDMSPDDYRAKWGLPRDYPMVAPAYAEARRGLARKIGLGRKKAVAETAAPPAPVSKPRGRKPAAEAVADTAAVVVEPVKRIARKAVAAISDAVAPAKPARKPRTPKPAAETPA